MLINSHLRGGRAETPLLVYKEGLGRLALS